MLQVLQRSSETTQPLPSILPLPGSLRYLLGQISYTCPNKAKKILLRPSTAKKKKKKHVFLGLFHCSCFVWEERQWQHTQLGRKLLFLWSKCLTCEFFKQESIYQHYSASCGFCGLSEWTPCSFELKTGGWLGWLVWVFLSSSFFFWSKSLLMPHSCFQFCTPQPFLAYKEVAKGPWGSSSSWSQTISSKPPKYRPLSEIIKILLT